MPQKNGHKGPKKLFSHPNQIFITTDSSPDQLNELCLRFFPSTKFGIASCTSQDLNLRLSQQNLILTFNTTSTFHLGLIFAEMEIVLVINASSKFSDNQLRYDPADKSKLVTRIEEELKNKQNPRLNGLLLVGGKSSRMGQEKALLKYGNRPQLEVGYKLLQKVTENTFISCTQTQIKQFGLKEQNYAYLIDLLPDQGPLSGILSAFWAYPHHSWMVIACDMPFITQKTLEHLISKQNPRKFATSYINPQNSLPEPLCTIYHPQIAPYLWSALGQKILCPRRILNEVLIEGIFPENEPLALENCNTIEEFRKGHKELNKHGHTNTH